jgi:hypothetical protein
MFNIPSGVGLPPAVLNFVGIRTSVLTFSWTNTSSIYALQIGYDSAGGSTFVPDATPIAPGTTIVTRNASNNPWNAPGFYTYAIRYVGYGVFGPWLACAGGAVNLITLPVANRQVPNWAVYQSYNVPGMPAGGGYLDPTTNVKVWKITSSTVPAANTNAMHSYSSVCLQLSCPWGVGGNQYTAYVFLDGNNGYIVDFQKGVGPSNYRAVPWSSDLHYSFSNNIATPQKAYYFDSASRLLSYNTVTGVSTVVKDFTASIGASQAFFYLEIDNADRMFVFMPDVGSTVYAWDSVTDTLKVCTEARLDAFRGGPGNVRIDEPHLDKDGRYVYLAVFQRPADQYFVDAGVYTNQAVWDLVNDKVSNTFAGWSHNGAMKSLTFGIDPNTSQGPEQYYIPAPITVNGQAPGGTLGDIAQDAAFGCSASHRADQWAQAASGLQQYYVHSGDAPSGGLATSWSLVSGSKWQTDVSTNYAYQQASVGVREVWELNPAGNAISAKLTKVANVAAITAPGMWCIVGTIVTVWRNDSGQPNTAGKTTYVTVTQNPHEALTYIRADFGDVRLACHHYTFDPGFGDYYAFNRCTVSHDGRLLMWTSNQGIQGSRKDVFIAEMPTSAAKP